LKNPSYSLRAFAKKLALSPAALSEILNSKRKVSIKKAQEILTRLNLNPEESFEIISQLNKKFAPKKNHTELNMDQFLLISEWYHFAILSLAETKKFKADSQWIAKRLGIKSQEAEGALERLERLGALIRNRKGELKASGQPLSTPDNIPSSAIRRQHSIMLNKALDSLDKDQIDQRDFLGVTMAIDPSKIPLAKKLLREFVGTLCSTLETGEQTEVYRFNSQLLPLSTLDDSGRESK
jgi:uncharacterized protein (TIGR02147 family)